MNRIAILLAAAALASSAHASSAPLVDAAGDFIPSYTGPQGPDLDVLSSEVRLASGVFDFRATLAGAVGTTPGGFYVFGVDRGAGTSRFTIAPGVLFDSVVVVNGDGTGVARDLLTGVVTTLTAGAIRFDGSSLSALVDAAALPSTGFALTDYTYNLWPRSPGAGSAFISDFAPDNTNAAVTAVPEPTTWALMIGGFGLVGASLRRRRMTRVAA